MKKYMLRNKGLLAMALLFGTIFSVGSTLVALILKEVIDVSLSRDMSRFVTIVLQTAVYLAVLGVSYGLYSTLSKKFICKVTRMQRNDAFGGTLKKNISDFKSVNSADYLSALTNDVKNVEENYVNPILLCLQNIIVFISSFAVMLYLSPLVTLCLFITIFLLIAVPSFFQNGIQKRQDNFSKKQSGLTVAIKDFLSGFEVIRSYRMNSTVIKTFEEKNDTVYHAKYALDKIVAAVEALSIMLGVVVQCSVLFVSAYLIITGKITAGALVALVQVSGTIVVPIQILSQNIPLIQGSKPIIERLNTLVNYHDRTFTGTMCPTFKTGITIKDLRFAYAKEQQIIKGIDFTFKKGEKYAIVGKSGCGKTTLINLLTGYYDGFEGEVLFDGVDMRKLDIAKLNEMFAVIHQNVYMFDASIKDNICLNKQIKQSDLQRALNMSGVEMFLGEEKSLDTSVGENGNNISGGQRQRVAVARALVQGKPILILDEGTSSVDMQTAYDIESQLQKIAELTVVTITHSLNPELLNGYNQIIFMETGTILETDTFANLMSAKGPFYDFFSLKK
ncbi:ABC transporter ATP-binding protein [Acetobacterium carbinolicum]|uniref:ABC transporter ATP-binding protein n=1 Tax=Acetobacterium carbinolicum TaxID=52690 RepID=UPI0039C8DD65